jgi:hypothetical protein
MSSNGETVRDARLVLGDAPREGERFKNFENFFESVAGSKKGGRYTPPNFTGCNRLRRSVMPFVVSEVQPTPNPNAAKFILDRAVSEQPTSFFNAGAAKDHPLASKLFDIPGVSSLLLLGDFITVNKQPEADWKEIRRRVQAVLAAA